MCSSYTLKSLIAAVVITSLAINGSLLAQEDPQPLDDQLQSTEVEKQPDDRTSKRYEARRVAASDQQQGVPMRQAIIDKLLKANDAEIELAQLAQQRTDNEQLRQLAQTFVQDHQKLNQELQQLKADQGNSGTAIRNRTGQSNEDAEADRNVKSLTIQPTIGQAQGPMVPQQLCRLMEQACDNNLKMTKQMLQQYQGQDFQMAFLGQQIVAHTMMLAELEAIESSGIEGLQSLTQQAISKTKTHLDKTKQLAKQLEDDRGSSTVQ